MDKGADFAEVRLIECHFWAWSEVDATGLAVALVLRGFHILVQRSAASLGDPALWNVEAGIEQSIDLTLSRDFTDELVRVAASHSGQYDGWGTTV